MVSAIRKCEAGAIRKFEAGTIRKFKLESRSSMPQGPMIVPVHSRPGDRATPCLKTNKQNKNKAKGWGSRELEVLYIVGRSVKWGYPFEKLFCSLLSKQTYTYPMDQ